MSEGTQDITEYNDGFGTDISLPEIPLPTAQEEEKKVIKDDVEVAFKFAFVGAGQGGCRIAETFSKLGYRKVAALNTAEQDLKIFEALWKYAPRGLLNRRPFLPRCQRKQIFCQIRLQKNT